MNRPGSLPAPSPEALAALGTTLRLGRRQFLKLSTLAASLAAGAGTLLHATPAGAALPPGITHLTEGEYQVFAHLAQIMLPGPDSGLLPFGDVPVMQTLDAALIAPLDPTTRAGLAEGIAYFEQGPQSRFGKPFSALDTGAARQFCDAWGQSGMIAERALAVGLKKLVGLAYWANPPTWKPLGYDGPVSRKWGLRPLGNAPLPKY